jgi:ketosteroid isomerase-like protein
MASISGSTSDAGDEPMIAPVDVTKHVFEAFGNQDVDAIAGWLHPDVTIEFYGPEVIPYARTFRGRDAARGFFETVLSSVDIHQFDPEEFICEGDKVVVTGHLRLTARSTGRPIESDFVHVITVADEKWLRFRDFMNTYEAAVAFG